MRDGCLPTGWECPTPNTTLTKRLTDDLVNQEGGFISTPSKLDAQVIFWIISLKNLESSADPFPRSMVLPGMSKRLV